MSKAEKWPRSPPSTRSSKTRIRKRKHYDYSEPSSTDSSLTDSSLTDSDSDSQVVQRTSGKHRKKSSHHRKKQRKTKAIDSTIPSDNEQVAITTPSVPRSELDSHGLQISGDVSHSSRRIEELGTLPERMGTKGNPARSRQIRKFPIRQSHIP